MSVQYFYVSTSVMQLEALCFLAVHKSLCLSVCPERC